MFEIVSFLFLNNQDDLYFSFAKVKLFLFLSKQKK